MTTIFFIETFTKSHYPWKKRGETKKKRIISFDIHCSGQKLNGTWQSNNVRLIIHLAEFGHQSNGYNRDRQNADWCVVFIESLLNKTSFWEWVVHFEHLGRPILLILGHTYHPWVIAIEIWNILGLQTSLAFLFIYMGFGLCTIYWVHIVNDHWVIPAIYVQYTHLGFSWKHLWCDHASARYTQV